MERHARGHSGDSPGGNSPGGNSPGGNSAGGNSAGGNSAGKAVWLQSTGSHQLSERSRAASGTTLTSGKVISIVVP
jgi:hypothetical protein